MNFLPDPAHGKRLNAVIYTNQPQVNGAQFLKYRIDNTANSIDSFIKFARKFPGAVHINFYSKDTRQFIEQFKF